MIYNYLKIMVRNFITDGMYTFIIVFGLAVGIAAALMIAQYVHFEMSFDKHYRDKDRIYYSYMRWENEKFVSDFPCHPAVGPLFGRSIPEVEAFTRLAPLALNLGDEIVLRREENGKILFYSREKDLYYADREILKVFSISMLAGDAASALQEPNTMIITRKLADKFFPDENALNKILKIQIDREVIEYTITGLVENPLPNSTLQYSALFSFKNAETVTFNRNGKSLEDIWVYPIFQTFIKLYTGSDPHLVEKKINEAANAPLKALKEEFNITESIHLFPFSDFHFFKPYRSQGNTAVKFSGDKRLIMYFAILALLILVISWANYINLTTAGALRRAKEVGLRKVNGARRKNIVLQFLFEFLFLNIIGLCLAFTIAQLTFPIFADIIGSKAEWIFWTDPRFWLFIMLFLILSTLISGCYPAFIMSNYNPSAVLKGSFIRTSKGANLRKGLVLAQLGLSAFLMMSIYVIYRQLVYMHTKDLGMSADQVMIVRTEDLDPSVNHTAAFQQLKVKLENQDYVKSISASDYYPGNYGAGAQMFYLTSDAEKIQRALGTKVISENYFQTMEINLLHGRDFKDDLNESDKVIINETAAHQLGFDPAFALGEFVTLMRNGQDYQIIGVVKDFSFSTKAIVWGETFFNKHWQWNNDPYNNFLIKLSTKNLSASVSHLEKEWNNLFPAPFDYFFLDTYFDTFYREEQQFASVFGFFSVLGVFITCMGLFGLSLYDTGSRTKEIGIRKSLGASVTGIMWLFSKEYVRLILIASAIGIPVGVWMVTGWLKNYPNRISLQADVILIPLLLMLCIAMFTVGYQTYKTAHMDPVKSLRNE